MSAGDENGRRDEGAAAPAVAGERRDRPAADASADPFSAWRELESKRIDARNRRTEAMARAVAANAEVHRRDAELRAQQLRFDGEAAERRHSLAVRIFTWGGGFAALLLTISLGFVFLGSGPQAAFAKEFVKSAAIALAGGGAFHLVSQAIRWMLRR